MGKEREEDPFAIWLGRYVKRHDIEISDLAKETEIHASTIASWIHRKSRVGYLQALKVCEVLNVRPPFLPEYLLALRLPYFGKIHAGQALSADSAEDWINVRGFFPENAYVLQVLGTCLTGAGIETGDFIVVVPIDEPRSGDICVVLTEEGHFLRRARWQGARLFFDSVNPAEPPSSAEYNPETCQIQGKVVTVLRSLVGTRQHWFEKK